jgi:transcriptional regulator
MAKALDPNLVLLIVEDLKSNVTQASVARKYGVSRAVVSVISRKGVNYVKGCKNTDIFDERCLARKAKRCKGCGGLVYIFPCLTCESRNAGRS